MLMNVVCFSFVYYATIRSLFTAGVEFAARFARGRMVWRRFMEAVPVRWKRGGTIFVGRTRRSRRPGQRDLIGKRMRVKNAPKTIQNASISPEFPPYEDAQGAACGVIPL
jgi:hypothetical protein